MANWHFIIPFYYGKNRHVVKKGGAPLDRKIDYLKQTVASIKSLGVNSQIIIFVCDEASYEQALKVHNKVQLIDCHPKHLPIETVKTFKKWFNENGSDNDIVTFNEDDQILYLSNKIIADIENTNEKVVFSPHRWAKLLFFFRIKNRPIFKLNGSWGILDNINKTLTGKDFTYNYAYKTQDNRNSAYAACWMTKGNIFKTIDFNVPMELIELESPSFAVFDSGIPVLKLVYNQSEPLAHFLVDHLSGYDYNRRLIKLF
ncbi:MAG: hypothetical protein ACOYMA_15250 [Bacteroidia bacterium]